MAAIAIGAMRTGATEGSHLRATAAIRIATQVRLAIRLSLPISRSRMANVAAIFIGREISRQNPASQMVAMMT